MEVDGFRKRGKQTGKENLNIFALPAMTSQHVHCLLGMMVHCKAVIAYREKSLRKAEAAGKVAKVATNSSNKLNFKSRNTATEV